MKRIKYYLAALVATVLLLSSCSDSFFDINTDPNNPAQATAALVLPSGMSGSAFVMGGYYQSLGGFWAQQYAQAPAASQWADWESYNVTEDDFDRQFTTLYAGSLNDYEYVRKLAASNGNWSYYAISTLMQAYTFQVVADLYDKVPFTEALQGDGNLQPHYTDGQVIYDSLLVRIDDAMSKNFKAKSSQDPGTNDLIFQGQMKDWQKFANTLKLKMYLRYVNVDVNKYSAQIKALLTENNFLDKDAKFSAFKAEETGYNPFFNTFVDRLAGNVIANKTLIDSLTTWGDPRKAVMFNPSLVGANYNGLATGDSKNHPTLKIDNYATPAIGNISPVYFFTKEETLFLVAEAQTRYGTIAAAQKAFDNGVKASLVGLNLADTAITYPYKGIESINKGIESIIVQKWAASTNKRSIEAFFDYNRTGYPSTFSKSITSVLSGTDRPKRLFFPASERKSNSNTPARVALTEKVWWGK